MLRAGTTSRDNVTNGCRWLRFESAPYGTVVWTEVDNIISDEAAATCRRLLPWHRSSRCCGIAKRWRPTREKSKARTDKEAQR